MFSKEERRGSIMACACALCAIVCLILMAVPAMNPGCISSEYMDGSVSGFAAMVSFSDYIAVFNESFELGLLEKGTFLGVQAALILLTAAMLIMLAGAMVSLFVKKHRKIAGYVTVFGAIGGMVSMLMCVNAYTTLDTMQESQIKRFKEGAEGFYHASLSIGAWVILGICFAALVCAILMMDCKAGISVARIAAVLSTIGLFIAGFNPGRVCDYINKNNTFFSSATRKSAIIGEFPDRYYTKGFITEKELNAVYILCLIAFIAVIAMTVGFCMSMGELRMQKISAIIMSTASVVGIASMLFMIRAAHKVADASANITKIRPTLPNGIFVYLFLFAIALTMSVIFLIRTPKLAETDKFEMQSKYKLFLMILPFIAMVVVFSYLPLWGWRYAFFDYTPGIDLSMRDFKGWGWFNFLIRNAAQRKRVLQVLKNTLIMSGLGIASSVLPLAFAIFISEIRRPRYKRFVQTVTTLPNFISWVMVYSVATAMFDTTGFVNVILLKVGAISTATNYLNSGSFIYLKMLFWGVWKSLGWSAIIYIAAISGIDQQLYEAATVDGAGRFRKMWHITVPGLMPTFFVLLLLSIAGILSNGMDQYYVFQNSFNKTSIEVLDLYTYNIGLGNDQIPLATAVGMVKSIISVLLLFTANSISKLIRGESIV